MVIICDQGVLLVWVVRPPVVHTKASQGIYLEITLQLGNKQQEQKMKQEHI